MAWRMGTRGFFAAAVLSVGPVPLAAQGAPACRDEPAFHLLDFWIGEWSVIDSGGIPQGHNRIEAVLGGCAITESWTSAAGGEGRSLFWVDPATKTWKQVWVTGAALAPGGTKEKTLIRRFDDGAVRFQGTVTAVDGRRWLDRTTLTPLADGRIRQHIEISTDDGATWRTTFDAFYVPDPARGRPDLPWPRPSPRLQTLPYLKWGHGP